MKIEKISVMNMDMLYDCVIQQMDSDKFKNAAYGRNFSQLLNHITITMNLTDVTSYEYMFLKMYCSRVSPRFYNDGESRIDHDAIKNLYPEIYQTALLPAISYVDKVNEENGCDKFTEYFLPTGVITSRAIITLTGTTVANIIELNPTIFFVKARGGECLLPKENETDENKFDPTYNLHEDETFSNYIIATFVNNFYKFIVDKVKYVDVLSDSFNYSLYLNKGDEDDITLHSVINPLIQLDMVDDPIPEIGQKLEQCKKFTTGSDVFDKSFTLQNTYIELTINTSFAVFLEFFAILPYEKFTSMEALNIPASLSLDDTVIPPSPDEKFTNRHVGRLTTVINEINKKYSSDTSVLKKLELTTGYVPYHFMITISLADIDTYFLSYLEKNDNSDNYVVYTTNTIMNKIIDFSKWIFKALV